MRPDGRSAALDRVTKMPSGVRCIRGYRLPCRKQPVALRRRSELS